LSGQVISLGAVIVDERNRYLLVHKYWTSNWEFPQGSREGNERHLDTLRRELKEEIGLSKGYQILPGWREKIFYHFKFRGEIPVDKWVIFYLLRVGSPTVHLSEEHTDYRWVTFKEGMKLLRHENYQRVLRRANAFLQEKSFREKSKEEHGRRINDTTIR